MRTPPRSALQILAPLVAGAVLLGAPSAARADGGFQLNNYEPSGAGTPFFQVDHPWYSEKRRLAIGVTFDYAHDPLVLGHVDDSGRFSEAYKVIEHAVALHIDAGISFVDRLTIFASLPLTLHEWGAKPAVGQPDVGIQAGGFVMGDPRLGVLLRVWNHPDTNMFSMHLGATVWIPAGAEAAHAGDTGLRLMPRLVLAGIFADHLRWALSGAFIYRPDGVLGKSDKLDNANAGISGPELQLGLGIGYTDAEKRLNVGPELALTTVVAGARTLDASVSSMELLFGAQYLIAGALQVGAAVGTGMMRDPGTPDLRVLFRIAYAPLVSPDRDKDGIIDRDDACPDDSGIFTPGSPRTNGCPDRDQDGVVDRDDQCPDEPRGDPIDPSRPGCPRPRITDRDRDGVPDDKDVCVKLARGKFPDAERPGCPMDRDKDGVPDETDRCPEVPQGAVPDPARAGCPLEDRDADGVLDERDQCPDVPQTARPDPARPGCPLVEAKPAEPRNPNKKRAPR